MTSPLKLALLAAAATVLPATPALAQDQGQTAQRAPASGTTCAPEHAAMGHCTPTPAQRTAPPQSQPAPKPQPPRATGTTCAPEHAAMGHCTPAPAGQPAPPQSQPAPQPQPQSTCLPGHAAMGHCTMLSPQPAPQPQSTCLPEHAAMGHCTPATTGAGEGTDLPAGNAPPPPLPTDHAADRVYGSEAMEMGRHHLQSFHGGQKMFQLFNNVMEYQARKGRDGYEWDSEAWYGGDINRLWLKSEGEGASGIIERAEVQALYSHALDPYFNLQAGVRYDFVPNPSRVYATVGIEGLAPSFFELEGALFVSNKGEVMARAEGYYDQRITQRLILQPRAELNFAAQSSRDIGVGAGLSDAEIGVRLRYDVRREFSPYVGVQYQRAFGRSRQYLRDAGERAAGFEFVAGIRTWF